jgi:protein tyrosine phosphatase
MLALIIKVRERRASLADPQSPLLVHCSAGVGRTGSYIAIDQAMDAFAAREEIDILEFCEKMRMERMAMIQHSAQFKFSCVAVAKWIRSELKVRE